MWLSESCYNHENEIFGFVFVGNFSIGRGRRIFLECSHSIQLFVKAGIGHELHPGAIRTPAVDGARNLVRSANCRLRYIDMCR